MAKIRTPMSEKMRKRVSDKTHFKKTAGKIDMKKKVVAMLKRK